MISGDGIQALVLARQFKRAGHKVILVDEAYCGTRWSNCVDRFHLLPNVDQAQYTKALLAVITKEHVDVFVPCGKRNLTSLAIAKTDLAKKCHVMLADEVMCRRILRKDTFIDAMQEIGVDVPVAHKVTSLAEAQSLLSAKTYIVESIESGLVDDISKLEISRERPLILQEALSGRQYYCQVLAWNGVVRLFSAHEQEQGTFKSILPLKHDLQVSSFLDCKVDLDALAQSRLAQRMQDIVTRFVSAYSLSGPLTVNFIANEDVLPISASPTAHPSLSCFYGSRGLEMAYTRLAHNSNDAYHWPIYTDSSARTYLFYHELYSTILPFNWFTSTPRTGRQLLKSVCQDREAIWDFFDPIPFVTYYHVQWMITFWRIFISGCRWKSIDVASCELLT